MLYRQYENFEQAYLGLNQEILRNPSLIEYLNTTMGGIDQVIIQTTSKECGNLNLGALGYKINKWDHLVKTYLGPDKIEELKHLGENISGLSAGFDFLRKTTHNGACMREIIISREKRKKPWDTLTVVWRTTELQRRWMADLILISRMAELIPNTNFTKFNLVLTTCYQSAMYIIPILKPVFNIDTSELDPKNPYTKVIITREAKYYKPDKHEHSLLASGERLVELYKDYEKGFIPPKITYKECKL